MTDYRKVASDLDLVRAAWRDCQRCELCQTRNRVVFWGGSHRARLAVVGEAPGESEDLEGTPFVGAAGGKFDELCAEVTATGPEPWSCFVINTLGCRPPGNAKPTYEQWKQCRGRLFAMLAAVRPQVVLLLGGTALTFLAGKTSIMRARGTWTEVEFLWRRRTISIPAMPTLHPAYLLRNNTTAIRQLVINDIRHAWERAQPASWVEGD
jgi:uracil-DNA glycosylase family 4